MQKEVKEIMCYKRARKARPRHVPCLLIFIQDKGKQEKVNVKQAWRMRHMEKHGIDLDPLSKSRNF